MARPDYFANLDIEALPSPCFVVDAAALEDNLTILADVARRADAHVLMALKAFCMPQIGSLVARYLSGTCSSGINEALLAREAFPGEIHVFSPAYKDAEFAELVTFADHMVFNSPNQWRHFRDAALQAKAGRPIDFALRVNPEHSEGEHAIYDPCAPGSRLGMTRKQLDTLDLDGISGLHFHTLCEQQFAPLKRTIAAFEQRFGDIIPQMRWVNFGGGHHITREGYDVEGLVAEIQRFRKQWGVDVYLEPGEAISLYAGVLVGTVLDLGENDGANAILDISATCHMPDVIEMPYRPPLRHAAEPGVKAHTYRFGGQTCLAGDVIGQYSFDHPLAIGDRIVFDEMAYYTMVKTNTFNGMPLPSIALYNSRTGKCEVVKSFGYADFRTRLG